MRLQTMDPDGETLIPQDIRVSSDILNALKPGMPLPGSRPRIELHRFASDGSRGHVLPRDPFDPRLPVSPKKVEPR